MMDWNPLASICAAMVCYVIKNPCDFELFSPLNFKTELTLAAKFMELETGLTSLLKRHKR